MSDSRVPHSKPVSENLQEKMQAYKQQKDQDAIQRIDQNYEKLIGQIDSQMVAQSKKLEELIRKNFDKDQRKIKGITEQKLELQNQLSMKQKLIYCLIGLSAGWISLVTLFLLMR